LVLVGVGLLQVVLLWVVLLWVGLLPVVLFWVDLLLVVPNQECLLLGILLRVGLFLVDYHLVGLVCLRIGCFGLIGIF
jgi:hypothetical protein